jgi:hypothetical protein
MSQPGANEPLYFGAGDDDDDQQAGVTDWMVQQEERSRVLLSKAIVDQLRRKLSKAERRLAYWTEELAQERYEEFRAQFRKRVAIEQATVDDLRGQLARRAAVK